MSQPENPVNPVTPVDEIQKSWSDLKLRVQQLETGNAALEQENKALRQLLENVVEHRRKSHSELVNVLTTVVSKLPLNDVGVLVSRLVEHNTHVGDVCNALVKGTHDDNILQPAILKALDKTKQDLNAAIAPLVDELIRLETPLDPAMLKNLVAQPDVFFSHAVIRACRGFVKGQVPRERIVKEFGEPALVLFKDLTTDPKLNPRPKAEEIMLGFAPDFEALLQQNPHLPNRAELVALHQKVRQSRSNAPAARAQKLAFLKLSFVLELLNFYENQSTKSPDVIFAQRLPPLIEQLVISGESDAPDENLIKQAEALLTSVIKADHRQAVVNNFGKGGGLAKTLHFILTFRSQTFNEHDSVTTEFVKHLIGLEKTPRMATFLAPLKLIPADGQKAVVRCLLNSGRMRREEAEPLGAALIKELGLPGLEVTKPEAAAKLDAPAGWDHVKSLIANRAAPPEVTAAIRKQLHGQYDADEVKAGWLTLTEAEPMVFVRVFCLLPYLPDGQTDPLARAVMETFITRLTHEKYAATYAKILNALKNLFKVKADSPALVNFISLVKWVDPAAAAKIAADIGMPAI